MKGGDNSYSEIEKAGGSYAKADRILYIDLLKNSCTGGWDGGIDSLPIQFTLDFRKSRSR